MKDEMTNTQAAIFYKLALAFSRTLSSVMKHKNISQKELSSKIGVSEAYISKILTADNNITIKTIAKFADALDCDVERISFKDDVFVYDKINFPMKINKKINITSELKTENKILWMMENAQNYSTIRAINLISTTVDSAQYYM